MKSFILNFFFTIFIIASITNCSSAKNKNTDKNLHSETDTIKIVNEEEEYEVIIIDPGFRSWLTSRAKSRGFYSLQFLENKNYLYVIEWNARVNNPRQYYSDLYTLRIDYDPNIKYGYEVNYLLYNYFLYFQQKYNQRLGGGIIPW
ncbi:hypothetical protein AXE80_00570 [Wenyingzhuangia fucanilytica]|uniref:Uncharacterized protein n=1 Tax=Wenyingzhuangia fucanilytica TaxID=1790137 RepID=A0A1B1Y276_9FLAO|nr:DUF6146 family protein [Wenyingzhuangia fucanilytica]ANW94876.1 hypothetical protein AXE80_00570 [Wenyingzhuangia fucanilytica]